MTFGQRDVSGGSQDVQERLQRVPATVVGVVHRCDMNVGAPVGGVVDVGRRVLGRYTQLGSKPTRVPHAQYTEHPSRPQVIGHGTVAA